MWATTSINMKPINTTTPIINFWDTDASGAGVNSLIYSSLISKVLSFDVTGTNTGFRFQGGSVLLPQLNVKPTTSTPLINLYDTDANGGTLIGSIYTLSGSKYLCIDTLGAYNTIRLSGGSVILGTGYRGRQGSSGSSIGNVINSWWTGTALQAWVDTSNIGNFTICDYRIKESIQPPSSVLERLCNVNMFNYEFKDISIFKKNGSHIGFYAHELKEAFPELNNIVDGEKDALTEDGDIQPQTVNAELTHLLMKAVQELNAKVIELSNKIIELENKLL